MRYEVYIPQPGRKDAWVRLLLEAESWAAALKSGLLRLGEDGHAVERAVCEVRPDGAYFVRDLERGRTFLLRETQQQMQAGSVERPAPRPRPAPGNAEIARSSPLGVHPSSPGRGETGRVMEEAEAALPFAPPAPAAPDPQQAGAYAAVLPRLLQELSRLDGLGSDLQAAAGHTLDVAMRFVPSESGSVLYTHVNGRELYFAAARGPKAEEVLAFRVPIGVGIAGFSAAEGTSLAVNDVKRDARFFSEISDSLGYQVKMIMAAPLLHQGRVYGAIELINRLKAPAFSEDELRLLAVAGGRLAEHLAARV